MSETEKKQAPSWLIYTMLGVIIGMLVVVIFLQASGGCEPKAEEEEQETTIIDDQDNSIDQPTDTRVFSGGEEIPPEPMELIDTHGIQEPRDTTAWNPYIEQFELVPGRLRIDVAYPWGSRGYDFAAPEDLYYTFWGGMQDTTPEAWYRELPKPQQVKPKRTILAVSFTGGAAYTKTTDTTWGLRPDFSVGLDYSPWEWLRLTPARFSYPPFKASAEIGIVIPIARK